MNIFNKKALEKLEAENKKLEKDKTKLIEELAELHTKLEVFEDLKETEPADCKRGPWCRACEFVKTFYCRRYMPGIGYVGDEVVYMCGKGESCKHFAQKETNNG